MSCAQQLSTRSLICLHEREGLRRACASIPLHFAQFLSVSCDALRWQHIYVLPLAAIHGLVTVSTPGPVQNTDSTEQLQVQDYWDRIIGTETTVKSVITFYIYTCLLLSTQQWHLALDDRPCAQHVQSTRRMSLTVKRPSTEGSLFLMV
jgi:hypothetical protein